MSKEGTNVFIYLPEEDGALALKDVVVVVDQPTTPAPTKPAGTFVNKIIYHFKELMQ